METAPELLQSVGSLMPLSIVTQGLVHLRSAATLVSTTGTLLAILAWAAVSLVVTFAARAGCGSPGRSSHVSTVGGARRGLIRATGSPWTGPPRPGPGLHRVGDEVHRPGAVLDDAAQHDRARGAQQRPVPHPEPCEQT